eukprot:TRINITY_DN4180_c0_g1_i1.p1 TRINITY_DN4180_c0_g1~~TRINITY_DN4180_c0_g1_i1.p1  ORF type:complete len:345 (-),score=61.10 TRINITY_DN4180_c0_g1_i1:303-1298(-)
MSLSVLAAVTQAMDVPRRRGPPPPPLPAKGKGKGKAKAKAGPSPVCAWPDAVLARGQRCALLESGTICEILVDNKRWLSIDQFFEAMKFSCEEQQEKIRGLKVPAQIQAAGEQTPADRDPDYNPLQTLYIATHARFTQDAYAREALLKTSGDALKTPFEEHWHKQTVKAYWYLRALHRVREELRPERERDQGLLEQLRREFAGAGFNEGLVRERLDSISADAERLRTPLDLEVVTISGESVTISALPLDDGLDLKAKVSAAINMHELSRMQLLRLGEELVGNQTVLQAGLQDGDELTVILKGKPLTSADAWGNLLEDIRGGAVRLRHVTRA